ADVGPIFRLELDPVAIPLHVVVQVPGGESRRDETDPRRAESDARKRYEDCSSDDRGTQLLPQTKYAHRFHFFPLFRSRVGQCPTPCNVRRKDSRKPWSSCAVVHTLPASQRREILEATRLAQDLPRGAVLDNAMMSAVSVADVASKLESAQELCVCGDDDRARRHEDRADGRREQDPLRGEHARGERDGDD